MAQPRLPLDGKVDISAFARLFEHTAASYKFLWTLAILRAIKSKNFSGDSIRMNDLIDRMLKIAEPPLSHFCLSFGEHDKMHEHIMNLAKAKKKEVTRDLIHRQMRELVPFRWLKPFLDIRNREKHSRIAALAAEKFNSASPPPYKYSDDREGIIFHPDWLAYLSDNHDIVEGWVYWHWARFLQNKNPTTPAIINKIIPPKDNRSGLQEPKKFWLDVLSQQDVFCIYSGRKINARVFALDHYVPQSFVGHNDAWNLAPIIPGVNSSKSNSLPHERYLSRFIEQHHNALRLHDEFFANRHGKLVKTYAMGLKLDVGELLDKQKLSDSYNALIPSLISIAKLNRFKAGWIYKG